MREAQRAARAKAEKAIYAAVSQFEWETGLDVRRVDIETHECHDGSGIRFYTVRDVRIEAVQP
jgi:hypothetical protein